MADIESNKIQETFSRETLYKILGGIVVFTVWSFNWLQTNIIDVQKAQKIEIEKLKEVKPTNTELSEKVASLEQKSEGLAKSQEDINHKVDSLIKVVEKGFDEQREAAKVYDSRFNAVLNEIDKLNRGKR